MAFKLVIFNSNTHTLPLGHLCILKACVKEGIRGGLRGPRRSLGGTEGVQVAKGVFLL